ncbi:hypothetical protein PanWU01x14_018310 [Parasponia andersonii]|uniref:Uncharacterized protein n=1 Tax=Parasponia andersonii TaxID=3476 RepID=A0A2P5DZ76_PARAD|nr:hypothetical protein PanWU01x14_018310 [Parasponia andersonii]
MDMTESSDTFESSSSSPSVGYEPRGRGKKLEAEPSQKLLKGRQTRVVPSRKRSCSHSHGHGRDEIEGEAGRATAAPVQPFQIDEIT